MLLFVPPVLRRWERLPTHFLAVTLHSQYVCVLITFGMILSQLESQPLRDTGHSAFSVGLCLLLGLCGAQSCMVRPFLPLHCKLFTVWSAKTEACLAQFRSARWKGPKPTGGFLHKAVLSVSLSMSSRMWPGTSLLAKSVCISGKMLRSGSETLELVSG